MFFQSASLLAVTTPIDFLFHTWSFQFMGKDIFAHDNWEAFMYFARLVIAFGAAGLLLIEARAKRLGERLSEKTLKYIGIAIAVLGFVAYFDGFNPNVRYPDYYHRHEFYHYYLGSKYSHALGYTRLYECTMIAEVENERLQTARAHAQLPHHPLRGQVHRRGEGHDPRQPQPGEPDLKPLYMEALTLVERRAAQFTGR